MTSHSHTHLPLFLEVQLVACDGQHQVGRAQLPKLCDPRLHLIKAPLQGGKPHLYQLPQTC